MRSLIWKEFHENLKWAAIPWVLFGGYYSLYGGFCLCDSFYLFVSFVGAVFGSALGILQMTFESQGDRRALLLHRPVSASQIFLAKALTGTGLYLAALGLPLAVYVVWIFLPGYVAPHLAFPARWQLLFPWFADILAGLVYYYAGALAALRPGRWYGSRILGILGACLCTFLVWNVAELWEALLAIILFGGLAAAAAWGSFLTAGDYESQPRFARFGLAFTFLAGLTVLSVQGKTLIERRLLRSAGAPGYTYYQHDCHGRCLIVERLGSGDIQVRDLDGEEQDEFRQKSQPEVRAELQRIRAPMTIAHSESFHGHRTYRAVSRYLVPVRNDSTPPGESWCFVPNRGVLVGYDVVRRRRIGSIGPDGFAPDDEPSRSRFEGELDYSSIRTNPDYLVFPGGVYAVDFAQRRVSLRFQPAMNEIVLGARDWQDDGQAAPLEIDRKGVPGLETYQRNQFAKPAQMVVGTDRAISLLDIEGDAKFSLPLVYDHRTYRATLAKLENPPRYGVDYHPSFYLGLAARETMPMHFIEYDPAGRELKRTSRPALAPRGATRNQPWFGLATSPAEAAVLWGTLYDALFCTDTGQHFKFGRLSGELLELVYPVFPHPVDLRAGLSNGRVRFYCAGVTVNGLLGAAGCYWLARRYAFSPARRCGWSCWGFLFGLAGWLVMFALPKWPARVACPDCRQLRIVTREACEHCGAAQAGPALDGTEVFEATVAERSAGEVRAKSQAVGGN